MKTTKSSREKRPMTTKRHRTTKLMMASIHRIILEYHSDSIEVNSEVTRLFTFSGEIIFFVVVEIRLSET